MRYTMFKDYCKLLYVNVIIKSELSILIFFEMKMKSKLFGLSAKSALYLLAICSALFTSCYEKEEVDVTPPVVLPDAAYVIVGNVYFAKNGEPVANKTVTIDGGTIQTDSNGAFIKEGLTAGQHVVTVDLDGYAKVARTVYLVAVQKGQTSLANVDVVLYDATDVADSQPEQTAPGTPAQAEELKGAVTSLVPGATVTVNTNGNIVVTESNPVSVATGESATVNIEVFTGFNSNITPATTKALTPGEIWLASASKYLNRTYGLQVKLISYIIPGVLGKTITGFKQTSVLTTETLTFDGLTGTVIYQGTANSYVIEPVYESHDSHDAHGGSSNAGGGAGGAE